MKINHTHDSPVLLRLIPENEIDIIHNARRFSDLKCKRIYLKGNGTLLINIDDTWPNFKEHDVDRPESMKGDYE